MKLSLLLFFILFSGLQLMAQERSITGKVTSNTDGLSIPGVSVKIKGSSKGVVTDIDGKFKINIPSDNTILVFTFVGYDEKEINVGSQKEINIVLKENVKSLDQLVVIGYGTQKKSDLTGSVSSVKAEDIAKVPVYSIDQALRGKASGVDITQNSGTPGGGTMIRIRGIGSINDIDPLWVVDGIPIDDYSLINPGDIASVEILKDASACAIYGSRAAGGVVLVSTKKGKAGKPTITYEIYQGFQQPWKTLKVMNAKEWATVKNEAVLNTNPSATKPFDNPDVLGTGTNWQKEIFRTAPMSNHQVSITGGNEKSQYAVSTSYFNQKGIIQGTDYSRITFRVSNDNQLTNKFKIGTNIHLNHTKQNTISEFSEYNSVLLSSILFDPTTSVKTPDGNYSASPYISDLMNPVAMIHYNNNLGKSFGMIGTAYAEYEIIKGLKFKSSLGLEESNYEGYIYTPKYFIRVDQRNDTNKYERSTAKIDSWTWENQLTYSKTYKKHDFTIMAAYSRENHQYPEMEASIRNLPSDDPSLRYLSTGNFEPHVGSSMGHSRLESVLGRVIYSYNNKYLITASIRRDGSSKFGKNYRYGTFPSFSLGWKLSNENFMKSIKWVSNLKLRGGWGKVGNQEPIPDQNSPLMIYNKSNYLFGNTQSFAPGTTIFNFINDDLRWEKSVSTNIGADIGLFSNKLELTIDYFIKKTTDMLTAIPISGNVGYGSNFPFSNNASCINKGIEISFTYRKKFGNDFEFEFSPNFTYVKNEVTDLGAGGQAIYDVNFRELGYISYTDKGHPIASFYGFKTNGIFKDTADVNHYVNAKKEKIQPNAKPGDVKFVDINGDGVIDNNDNTIIGNPWPKFVYGAELDLTWKNWDLSIFVQGVSGNKVFNGTKYYLENGTAYNNLSVDMLNRWTPTNTSTNMVRMDETNLNDNYRPSDRYIENGSFIRLKNIQLAYNLPESLLKIVKISGLKLYLRSQNLLTFTKYSGFDPEVGNGDQGARDVGIDRATYPQARSYMVGAVINF